ncbi:hypothetical protein AB0G32_09355 [Streptomyces sp. NPDC023723]
MVARAARVTDGMLQAAAEAVAGLAGLDDAVRQVQDAMRQPRYG